MREIINKDKTVISVYDTSNKSLVGVFNGFSIASRYLFDGDIRKISTTVRNCWERKRKILSDLGITVAIRTASQDQTKLLGDDDYYISGEYKEARLTRMNGFGSTRYTMYDAHVIEKYGKQKS